MMDNDMHESLETVLQSIGNLDCNSLTEPDFERIGDAVMEKNHPGEAHEAMDQMMGGEGSENLKNMHIGMGKSYLGCYNESGDGVVNNMGYMMGGNYGNWTGSSMMYGGTNFLWLVNSLLLTALLVTLIRYFWIKGSKKK